MIKKSAKVWNQNSNNETLKRRKLSYETHIELNHLIKKLTQFLVIFGTLNF